jgi:hypothetical protein
MGGGHEGVPWHRRSVARPPLLPTNYSTPIDSPTSTTHWMHTWHGFSFPLPIRATMVWDDGAPAVGPSFPRVLDNTRLIGVPQAGPTKKFPGCHPSKHPMSSPKIRLGYFQRSCPCPAGQQEA